jgi:hypothetical protein
MGVIRYEYIILAGQCLDYRPYVSARWRWMCNMKIYLEEIRFGMMG